MAVLLPVLVAGPLSMADEAPVGKRIVPTCMHDLYQHAQEQG